MEPLLWSYDGIVVVGPDGATVVGHDRAVVISLVKLLLWARRATVAVGLGLACCDPWKSC